MRQIGRILTFGLLAAGTLGSAVGADAAVIEPAATTLHYAANGSYASAPEGVGFNIWDVGPYAEEVAELPAGKRALIWIGDGWDQCAPETVPDADFYPLVDALASNPKVWGWFIWDEPDVNGCPGLVDIITERATYIKHKSGGRQRTFIVGDGGWGAAVDGRLAPARTGVDLIGISTFTCYWASTTSCDLDLINQAVNGSVANGIPRSALVPVFQAFGRGAGSAPDQPRMPTPSQMRQIMARWDSLLPSPVFDYTYSWAIQPEWMETALSTDPSLQAVFRARFTGSAP
jgi:hypothetical protein